MRSGGPTATGVATVNDTQISLSKANYILRNRVEQLKKILKNDLPEEYISNMRLDIVNSLINEELVIQELNKYGIQASNEELAAYIKNDPQFIRNGKFDVEYYTNRFLPGYHYQTGISFEKDMQRQLTAQTLVNLFAETLKPTEQEIALNNKLTNTKFTFEVIKVPVSKTSEGQDNQELQADPAAKEKAENLHALWKKDRNLDDTLKEYNLTKTKSPALTYARLKSVFGGKADVENLKKITQLSKAQPFLDTYITEGNYYYIVKLSEKTLPDATLDDESKLALQTTYSDNLKYSLESSFIKDLRQKADIKIAPFVLGK